MEAARAVQSQQAAHHLGASVEEEVRVFALTLLGLQGKLAQAGAGQGLEGGGGGAEHLAPHVQRHRHTVAAGCLHVLVFVWFHCWGCGPSPGDLALLGVSG